MANSNNEGHYDDEQGQVTQERDYHHADSEHSADKPEPQENPGKDKGKGTDTAKDGSKKPKSRWPLIILAIIVVLAIIAGFVYWLMRRGLEDTDDAYTEGRAIAMATMVSGYVTELNIDDNQLL